MIDVSDVPFEFLFQLRLAWGGTLSNLGRIFIAAAGFIVGMFLLSQPAYANPIACPLACLAIPIMGIISLFIIVFAEVLIFTRVTSLDPGEAFTASIVINIISTVFGFFVYYAVSEHDPTLPLAILGVAGFVFLVISGILLRKYFLMIIGGIPLLLGAAGCFAQHYYGLFGSSKSGEEIIWILTFIICFGLTLALEIWPARIFMEDDEVERGVLFANIGSYIAVGIMMFVFFGMGG